MLERATSAGDFDPPYADWRPGDQRVFVADIRKAGRLLGWSPKVATADGVARLLAWIRENRGLFTGWPRAGPSAGIRATPGGRRLGRPTPSDCDGPGKADPARKLARSSFPGKPGCLFVITDSTSFLRSGSIRDRIVPISDRKVGLRMFMVCVPTPDPPTGN